MKMLRQKDTVVRQKHPKREAANQEQMQKQRPNPKLTKVKLMRLHRSTKKKKQIQAAVEQPLLRPKK